MRATQQITEPNITGLAGQCANPGLRSCVIPTFSGVSNYGATACMLIVANAATNIGPSSGNSTFAMAYVTV